MKSLEKDADSILREIGTKIRKLEKMTKEQKILALNISIEASRTGESGKGLKVVANQMQELTENMVKIYDSILKDVESEN